MTPPSDFLIALGQALSTAGLYGAKHPAFQGSASNCFEVVRALLAEHPRSRFSFLEGEAIFGERRIRELRDWQWAATLGGLGLERLEIEADLQRDEFDRFLTELLTIVEGQPESAQPYSIELPHIRAGRLGPRELERLESADRQAERPPAADERPEEAEAIDHLMDQAESEGLISLPVARAVVQSLAVALQYGRPLMEMLIPLRNQDEYSTIHSMNVSVLSMSLAESIGVAREHVREIGEAALLHDIGKVLTPSDVLQKPDKLTPEEWEIIKNHPVDGAKILLRSPGTATFAAVVAYEHHITWQGGGYPKLRYPRRPHPVSQLVQICDIFDALRTERPFRGPWSIDKVLKYFDELSGTDINPETLSAFKSMLGALEAAPVERRELETKEPAKPETAEASASNSSGGDAAESAAGDDDAGSAEGDDAVGEAPDDASEER